jgi:hypothetical protein
MSGGAPGSGRVALRPRIGGRTYECVPTDTVMGCRAPFGPIHTDSEEPLIP